MSSLTFQGETGECGVVKDAVHTALMIVALYHLRDWHNVYEINGEVAEFACV